MLTKEELLSELNNVKEALEKQQGEKISAAEKKSEEAIAGLQKSIDTLETAKLDLEKQLSEFELKSKDQPIDNVSIGDQISKSLKDNEAQIAKAEDANVKFKAAAVVTTANFGAGVIRGFREPGVTGVPYRDRIVSLSGGSLVRVMNGGQGSNPLSWVERVPKEGGPLPVAEGGTKPFVDWTYVSAEVTESTIAVILPITKQALRNMRVLGENINGELMEMLEDEINWQALLGDGNTNTAGTGKNWKGIMSYAKAFTGSGLAGKVEKANVFDVIRAAILQVREGNKAAGYERHTGYRASAVLVSPSILAEMDLTKDANGVYLLPPYISADKTVIKGVQVIENEYLGDDDFVVGDFSKALINVVEGVEIEVGYINDDFAKNRLCLRAELTGMQRVKAHEAFAFVKGDFTSAKALLLPEAP